MAEHDGDELLARLRFRCGVSSVLELFGIQPSCSSGECSGWGCFFRTFSSKFPMRSSRARRAPGVQGKVFACGNCGRRVAMPAAACGDVAIPADFSGADDELPCMFEVEPPTGASLRSCSSLARACSRGSSSDCSVRFGVNWKAFNLVLLWEVAGMAGFARAALGSRSFSGCLLLWPRCHCPGRGCIKF